MPYIGEFVGMSVSGALPEVPAIRFNAVDGAEASVVGTEPDTRRGCSKSLLFA